jgi:multiple sugar transport system substrate-binding protein
MIRTARTTTHRSARERLVTAILFGLTVGLIAALVPHSTARAQDTVVTFWNVWGGTRAPILRALLDDFEAQNPGIRVENVTLDGQTSMQRMLTAIAGGQPPDLYMTGSRDLAMWADLGAFMALDEYVARDGLDLTEHLFEPTIVGSMHDGQLIQLPFKITSSMMIWFNKDHFEAAGLDPENPPRTWAELEEAAAALTIMNGDVIEQLGFNICIQCSVGPEDAFVEWLSRNGGRIVTEDNSDIAFDDERGIETLTWMVEFADNTTGGWGNMVQQYGSTWNDQRPAFYAGRVSMLHDGPWFLDILRQNAPDMLDRVGVFLAPINADNPDAEQRYLAHGTPGYAIPRGARNPDAAWEVLKFIALADDGACEFFMQQARTDTPLVNCGDAASAAENPFLDTFMENVDLIESINPPPVYAQIARRLLDMQESALLGQETPEEAIRSAAEELRRVMQDQ